MISDLPTKAMFEAVQQERDELKRLLKAQEFKNYQQRQTMGSLLRVCREMKGKLEVEMREEEAHMHGLIEKQAKLLTAVANALNGEPPEDTLWSHHDLGEKAYALHGKLKHAIDTLNHIATRGDINAIANLATTVAQQLR